MLNDLKGVNEKPTKKEGIWSVRGISLEDIRCADVILSWLSSFVTTSKSFMPCSKYVLKALYMGYSLFSNTWFSSWTTRSHLLNPAGLWIENFIS